VNKHSDGLASFLERWSRRELKQKAGSNPRAAIAKRHPDPDPTPNEYADFDFSALDFNSDFVQFMRNQVPDNVRSRALRQLWLSSVVISRPDDLDDYLEDFSEEAMGQPVELARSAYQVGRGFASKHPGAAPTERSRESEAAESLDQKAPSNTTAPEAEQSVGPTESGALAVTESNSGAAGTEASPTEGSCTYRRNL
jgi:hypothetical protein